MDPELLIYIGNNYGHLQTLFDLGVGHRQNERSGDHQRQSVLVVRRIELHGSLALGKREHFNISNLGTGGDQLPRGRNLEALEILSKLILRRHLERRKPYGLRSIFIRCLFDAL